MKMSNYEFQLTFALPARDADPDQFVDTLYEAGCDDATIGVGRVGQIGLMFNREAASAKDAIQSAIDDVLKGIPGARLIEAAPDYVGLTEAADIAGFSRQNMRSLMIKDLASFPIAVHGGKPAVYHLIEVLQWFKDIRRIDIGEPLLEISSVTRQVNLTKELRRLSESAREDIAHAL